MITAPTTEEINQLIQNRQLHRAYDENTYGTVKLYEGFGKQRSLKWIKLMLRYKGKKFPKWTVEDCEKMLPKCPDSWTDHNGVTYLYDWGCGENKVIRHLYEDYQDLHDLHEPQLDHIIAKDKGGSDDPSNIQVLPALINRVKNNLELDTWLIVRNHLDRHFGT